LGATYFLDLIIPNSGIGMYPDQIDAGEDDPYKCDTVACLGRQIETAVVLQYFTMALCFTLALVRSRHNTPARVTLHFRFPRSLL